VVTDENVADWWGHQVMRQLDEAGLEVHQVTLPAGESFKNIQTLSYLWEAFADAHLDRKSTVVAMGGGVVTDLAGFAAATYLRGIPWVAMPTSLLGMVDASIGGKTGIDLQKGKNLAGAFFAPRAVLVYPEFLSTLPDIEIRNGMAEVVKAALIGDPGLFTTCARGWEAISQQEKTGIEWHQLISRAIAVKIGIIQKDPYEKELRRALNLGHTLGHAIEAATDYRLRHGEAVAIGMVAEARLGEQLGYTEPGLSSSIAEVLSNLGLPIQFPREMEIHEFQEAIRVDKKHLSSEVRLPLPVGIGQAPKQIDVMEEILWTPFWS
jgi:3-dehydroquinate synthase